MPRGKRCVAHRHRAMVSEENHHCCPQSRGGTNEPGNRRWVCANAHGDVHYFLDAIERQAKTRTHWESRLDPVMTLPWSFVRNFGLSIRELATDGWLRYAEDFLAGRWDRHAAVWFTSGQPLPTVSAPPYAVAAQMGTTWRYVA